MHEFTGWPADGPVVLAAIATDNTRETWDALRERHAVVVLAPMRALAAALEPEFGPVRVLRPLGNRRFRPDAPPCRTDTGGVARTVGGCTSGVVLSAVALTVTAGIRSFDGPQRRRYRVAVGGPAGVELVEILDALTPESTEPGSPEPGSPGPGSTGTASAPRADPLSFTIDRDRDPTGTPRGFPADHPRIGLLRRRGLQVVRSWELGPWAQTAEPLARVRAAWRAGAPLLGWLGEHVGPVPPRPRLVEICVAAVPGAVESSNADLGG